MRKVIIALAILLAALVIPAAILMSVFSKPKLETNNTVFTEDFFDGVESAYLSGVISPELYGNKKIEGEALEKLCRALAALELETTEEKVVDHGEVLYFGDATRVVFSYKNGDIIAFYMSDNKFAFLDKTVDSTAPDYELTYPVINCAVSEELLAHNYKVVNCQEGALGELLWDAFGMDDQKYK